MKGRQANLKRLDTLPYVESEFTKRFKFDAFENPKLATLRERHGLEKVIAPGRDEFERQVLLRDWTHRQFKKFGRPSTNCHGALGILGAIGEGHTFFCAQYAGVLVSAAASPGCPSSGGLDHGRSESVQTPPLNVLWATRPPRWPHSLAPCGR